MREIVIRSVGTAPSEGGGRLEATFGEDGGTIGRGEDCALVLPDPDRAISRQHARIVWRGNGFSIVAHGANPTWLNGSTLSRDDEAPLHSGDELRIGGYRLQVENLAGAAYRAAGVPETVDSTARPILPDDFDPFDSPPARPVARGGSALDFGSLLGGDSRVGPASVVPRSRGNAMDSLFPDSQPASRHSRDPLVALGIADVPEPDAEPVRAPSARTDLDAPFEPPRIAAQPVAVSAPPASTTSRASSYPGDAEARDAGPDAAPADVARLRAALLKGLGLDAEARVGELTPELAERIGSLLREAVQGTVDLLQARSMLKREMRADVTMVGQKGNNPLKFAPDAECALVQLLAPRLRGFIAPEEAMREAYADVRAHEAGMLAGLRAAVARILDRFDPRALETRIASGGALSRLVQGSRRAQLWDAYTVLYRTISNESTDDFRSVLGREFLEAYRGAPQARSVSGGDGRTTETGS